MPENANPADPLCEAESWRSEILSVAKARFMAEGYAGTEMAPIIADVGADPTAVYAVFPSKAALFVQVIEDHSVASLERLIAAIDSSRSPAHAIEAAAHWADERSRDGPWSALLHEHILHVRQTGAFGAAQAAMFMGGWTVLGEKLFALFPKHEWLGEPHELGALVFELAYAPAMSFVAKPGAGDLVRLGLGAILRATTARSELARHAGSVKTPARAAASRANGAKGGRPKKKPTAI